MTTASRSPDPEDMNDDRAAWAEAALDRIPAHIRQSKAGSASPHRDAARDDRTPPESAFKDPAKNARCRKHRLNSRCSDQRQTFPVATAAYGVKPSNKPDF